MVQDGSTTQHQEEQSAEDVGKRGTAQLLDILEANLNDLYDRCRDPENHDLLPELGFFLQVSMFHYEMARELVSLEACPGSGFAQALAVRGMIHRTVAFGKHLRKALLPQMYELAARFTADLSRQKIRDLRRRFKPEIAQVLRWERITNKAAGYYDSDVTLVVSLLDGLTYEQVVETVQGFIRYTGNVLSLFSIALNEAPSKSP
ncbi:hypothetical protein KTE49_11855 [Burkholderia multivorans]|uniref:hypothetical protein n=1 Tax=Burkholderia multivorans TaxID=87883 RepID=UPI0011B22AF0|nr:hypothetical protein [Burkholderia multivorans]MBJ9616285.1 hypothetical protein [Burkholderia multivorans]MBU9251806.1 hypothetical protein [Burkholderia multivorans]MBU9330136.1 hypothetical protein [Burkholderia multivorans]MBU9395250.1 hypothetical protein [Burkholderia multivorans]MBU9531126.1 hypothetical protein [Burkholderia multivorans]